MTMRRGNPMSLLVLIWICLWLATSTTWVSRSLRVTAPSGRCNLPARKSVAQGSPSGVNRLRADAGNLRRQASKWHSLAFSQRRRAARFWDRAARFQDRADEFRKQGNWDQAEKLENRAERLEDRAERLEDRAERLEDRAKMLVAEAVKLEDLANELSANEDPKQAIAAGIRNGCIKPPGLPPDRPLVGRENAVNLLKQYIKESMQNQGKTPEGKFPLLGTCGMKGIGKSALLWHGVLKVVPEAAKEVSEATGTLFGARSVYVTFNGGTAMADYFIRAFCAQGFATYQSYSDAFWSALLACCGVEVELAVKLGFAQSVNIFRQILGMPEGENLILMVDEVGTLEELSSISTSQLLQALMRLMDVYNGKLVFVFSHIRQDILEQPATGSGREILTLPLPALPVAIWASEPAERGKVLQAAAQQHPGLYQLLLGCCGHPRSVFDGLDRAIAQVKPLLESPSEMDLNQARDIIKSVCKFNEFTNSFMNEVVPQWFRGADSAQAEKLQQDGILLTMGTAPNQVPLLHPLLLQWWAANNFQTSTLARHLHVAYQNDAIVGLGTEKKMEAVLYNYEAVLRMAFNDRSFTVQEFYKSTNIGENYTDKVLFARIPLGPTLVHTVRDFSNKTELVALLEEGYIVVSEAQNESGIEYLSPFTDKKGNLIVAATQCKFITGQADWSTITKKVIAAMEKINSINDTKLEFFPVVYTTSDQNSMWQVTCEKGVYFTALDLFKFIGKMGVLRLQTQKPGKALTDIYPWLRGEEVTDEPDADP